MIRARDIPRLYRRGLLRRPGKAMAWMQQQIGQRRLPLNLFVAPVEREVALLTSKKHQGVPRTFLNGAFVMSDDAAKAERAIIMVLPDPLLLPSVQSHLRMVMEAQAPADPWQAFMAQREDFLRLLLRNASVLEDMQQCSLIAFLPGDPKPYWACADGPFGARPEPRGTYWGHLDERPSLTLYLDAWAWLRDQCRAWDTGLAAPALKPWLRLSPGYAVAKAAAFMPDTPLVVVPGALPRSPVEWPWVGRERIRFIGDVAQANAMKEKMEAGAIAAIPQLECQAPAMMEAAE